MGKRIISSVVGIAIGITVLIFAETPVLPAMAAALAAIALNELLKACECTEYKLHTMGCYAFGIVMPFMCAYVDDMRWKLLFAGFVIELMFMGYVGDHKKLPFSKLCEMVVCTIMVTFNMCGLVMLHRLSEIHGISYIVITLMAAWVCDGGAYFVGTAMGKHKLCPDISPKKTVEGAVGGVIVNVIVLCIYCFVYQLVRHNMGVDFGVNYIIVVVIGIVSSILGMFGDLTASLLKREHNIKDYGNIIPGHGGIMDRFDSVLFVMPFIVMLLNFFEIFPAK